jgi:hypothetical protein
MNLQKEFDFLKLMVARFHEQEKINSLELDIVLLRIKEIYEYLLRIKLINEVRITEMLAATAPSAQEISNPQQTCTVPVVADINTSTATEVSISERVVVNPENITAEEEPIPAHEKKKQSANPVKPAILAEKIGPGDFLPMNETMVQQKTHNDLSSKLQTSPLSSITSGIGLNDKFLYVRELFKNDNILYNKSLQHLDALNSLKEALDFIDQHFDWDKKNETTQNFINLIYRKYRRD